MGIHKITKLLNLKNLRSTQVSPNLRIPQGVQAEASFSSSRIKVPGLLTSFIRRRGSKSPRLSSAFAPTIALAIVALGISFFSQTAYAASYINVSSGSGGTVSLGSIKPSATGVSASGSDTLTITTNCSAGYSVYVSAQNGGDTNLTNTNSSVTSNNTISASSTAVGSAATALNSNTWGITGDSASASASKYVGLPSYADATNTALISNSSASTTGDNKSTVYYGVKVDTTLSPGTYSGDVLYTTLVSDKCNNYTVHFDANGGAGTMSDQTIPVGTATNLTMNTFTRSGYAFLGWSTDKNATGQTYLDGQSVKDITDFNSTITLYAVWAASSGTMQSWTGCPSLAEKQSVFLTDTRDNKVYAVKKLPDGKCWMMQNLTIGMDGAKTLTDADTNIDDGKTYYLPPAGKQGSSTIDDSSTLTATTTADFASSKSADKHAKTQFRTKVTTANDSGTGYYSFYTATLGFSSFNDGKTFGSSTRDICPKGWRLPWSSDSGSTRQGSAEFYTLALTYNNSPSVWTDYIAPTSAGLSSPYSSDSKVREGIHAELATDDNNFAGFSYSGYWTGANSSANDVGLTGFYWSSSVLNTYGGYYLSFGSTTVRPQNNTNKNYGLAVRCVAQNNYTISYSNTGADSGEASKTSESAYESGSVAMPTVGTMTKSGYEFKGWALTSGATDPTYTAEQTVTISALITAASSAGQTTTPGSTITLYPVWVIVIPDDGNLGTMQDFICNNLTSGHTATLTDSRDNQTYTVYRWQNTGTAGTTYPTSMSGYCIMTQDLSLGYVTGGSVTKGANLSLTTSTSNFDTNASDSSYETITLSGTQTVAYHSSGSDWDATDSYTNKQYINGPKSGSETYSSHSYYSYGAALVVCPKGWRLPTETEYLNVRKFVGGNIPPYSPSKIIGIPYDFGLGGTFSGGSGFSNVGSGGSYWSSTQINSTHGYSLDFTSSSFAVTYGNNKSVAKSVRCVAEPYDEGGTMQETKASALSEGKTTILTDSRDEQKYTVYRWPSTGTAGTDYPTGMAGYAIMTQDLSLGYVTGGSITKGSNLVLSTDTSAGSTTSSAPIYNRTGTSDWSSTNDDSNLQYINGPQTGQEAYSSHSYYSYGAAQKVCPKGWRPPTNTEYGNIKTFMGGNNSTGSSKIRGTPYNFVYGGGFTSSGWLGVGSYGYYWSSTQNSSTNGYYLYFDSSYLNTFNDGDKYNGRSVRCVAAP